MTVYVINNMTVTDRDGYKAYVKAFLASAAAHGCRVLAAANLPAPVEGTWPYDRTVLLEFPSRAAVESWMNSAAFSELSAKRRASTNSNVVVLDALPA